MTKEILKNQKGVSLVALAIAIVILVIITNVLIYNAQDGVQIKILNNLYNDVDNLKGKVSEYYTKYGTIPANKNIEYTNIEVLKQANIISSAVDTGKFYVLDLSSLDNLTLNYGEDYKKITPTSTQEEINNLRDLYIINSVSQNIFNVEGVSVDGKKYFTNYTSSEIDTVAVKLKFYDGVKLPDGCSYVSGSKLDSPCSLTIKDDSTNIQYIWVPVKGSLEQIPDGVTNIAVDKEEEFLNSVDTYGGYWKHTDDKLKYIVVDNEDNYWSEAYDKEGIYTDINKDSAYIPKGFKVSRKEGLNKINNGLVVKDQDGNEYVWISVPKNITIDCGPNEIETALKKYVDDYRSDGYEDKWYNGCGLLETEYNDLKQRMLESIQEKGGFFIGRYEAGLEANSPKTGGLAGATVDSIIASNGLPVSKQDKYIYNYITCSQAQGLSNRLTTSDYDVSLMFGIQWDLVCKFMQDAGIKTKEEINIDSSAFGNYKDSSFKIIRGAKKDTIKANNTTEVLTTGVSNRNFVLNLYDFAGNGWEFTLENNTQSGNPCIFRGGAADINGVNAASCRGGSQSVTFVSGDSGSFRVALY